MSSAIHTLQKAILDPNQSLTQLLRQTKLIAAKLNLVDIEKWTDLELNGYPDEINPPEYRAFGTESLMVRNPQCGWQYVTDVPTRLTARQPIAELEHLSKEKSVNFAPPEHFVLGNSLGMTTASGWPQRVTVPPSEFKLIIEFVRNELLQWAIELEKRGVKGDDMGFNEKERQSVTGHVYNIQKFTGVLGNVTGSQVTVYDYSSVSQLLLDHSVPKAERRELEDIMDDLKSAPPEKKPSLIQKGKDWIVRNKEFLGASAEAVGKAIGAAIDKS